MKRFKIFIVLICALGYSTVSAQTMNSQVYSLFVINIAKYSSWPSQESEEFNITVFGKSKVYDELVKQNGKVINGQTIRVTTAETLADIKSPSVLYLSDGKTSMFEDIQKHTHGKSVMIIAEREGLYKKGAGFSFIILDNGTLRYDMNISELEKRMIRVSKNLTSLANATL
jgi:hypothetical protein